jgi:hypothetical protein
MGVSVVNGRDIAFGILVSFGFAIALTLPMVIAMAITITLYALGHVKRSGPTYILLAFSVAIEVLWLMALEHAFGGMSI